MAEPLKVQFGPDVVRRLAVEISTAYPAFRTRDFVRNALTGYDALELMDRGRHLAQMLHRYLPDDFGAAVDVLLATLPPRPAPAGGMASFYYLPHTEFIRAFGVPHFAHAMQALHVLTRCFTGEWALRPFLEHHRDATLAQLDAWVGDENEHVRRLVSEGTRPRLPWAPRLREFQRDPAPVIRLLTQLRDDPSLYVRRSVANNLNDIGKDHPALLVQVARDWMIDASAERRWIVSHALRSAIKAGDADALAVLGHGAAVHLTVESTTITPRRPPMGAKVVVQCTLHNATRRRQAAIVDLRVHFVKANGSTAGKVFKLSTVALGPGERVTLRKTVSLADLSTRTHYPGKHAVELQMNGAVTPIGAFTLVAASSVRSRSVRSRRR
ncbi:MAG: DNA alkylation repair protein [Gemmatimonadaceae bacterium]|jgi:3-methyladenine DNA glycosylase AlkC|nr:DNA alkylation repair protein [Gemmatimonadaceae bacterium]